MCRRARDGRRITACAGRACVRARCVRVRGGRVAPMGAQRPCTGPRAGLLLQALRGEVACGGRPVAALRGAQSSERQTVVAQLSQRMGPRSTRLKRERESERGGEGERE
eukprot:2753523-Pleurochrysis_carterae.AAC.1